MSFKLNKVGIIAASMTTLLSPCSTSGVLVACGQDFDTNMQKIIDKDRLKYHIPGIEVTVQCPGEAFSHDFVSGTTTLEGGDLVNNKHLFQIGSETKSFISAIILQLEAEGSLSINNPVELYLPDVPADWKKITIKQLLNHSSGVFNYTDVLEDMFHQDPNMDFKKQWSADELINLVVNKPLYYEPGTGWHYSNTNYVIAGLIIEQITGKSVDDVIKSRLIEPLQLSNTYYAPYLYNEQIMEQMAHGYSDRGFFPDEPRDITDTNTSWANTAGAMISTSHDVAIWFKALMNGSLLPAQQMNELMTLVDGTLPSDNKPVGYGLGVMHDSNTFNQEAWWHSGGTLGYSALMVWLKCNDVVLAVNVNHTTTDRDIYDLTKDLSASIQKSDPSNQCGIG